MLVLIDNYDSFTFNLYDYFRQLGQDMTVLRNNEVTAEQLAGMDFSGLVISPGPGVPENSGNLMEIIHAFHDKVPILGICLGHQALGQFFGGSLVRAPKPMHGKVSEIATNEHPMWDGLPGRMKVCRYHSLVIRLHPENPLTITATSTDDQCIMAFAHESLPVWGIQFHPEAILTEHGKAVLFNWLKAFNLHSISSR